MHRVRVFLSYFTAGTLSSPSPALKRSPLFSASPTVSDIFGIFLLKLRATFHEGGSEGLEPSLGVFSYDCLLFLDACMKVRINS